MYHNKARFNYFLCTGTPECECGELDSRLHLHDIFTTYKMNSFDLRFVKITGMFHLFVFVTGRARPALNEPVRERGTSE